MGSFDRAVTVAVFLDLFSYRRVCSRCAKTHKLHHCMCVLLIDALLSSLLSWIALLLQDRDDTQDVCALDPCTAEVVGLLVCVAVRMSDRKHQC